MKRQNMDIQPQRKKEVEIPRANLDAEKATKFSQALGETPVGSETDAKQDSPEKNMSPGKNRKRFWKDWSKKQRIVFSVVLVVAIAAASFLIYWYGFAQRGEIQEPEAEVVVEPAGPLDRSPLTGLQVPPASAAQTPMAIIIENLSSVRPQSGLSKADVVYEFLAEGGITRFLVVFASTDVIEPDLIGPVRSLREYFVPVGLELLAAVYHVGGSPGGLDRAREWGLRSVNQFFDSKYYWRDSAVNGQGAPHNMWTRMPQTKFAIRDHSWPQDDGQNIRAWEFSEDAKSDQSGQVNYIKVPFSSGSYNVFWEYDADSKTYKRYQGDDMSNPHLDRNNDEQLAVRNIVVQYCDSYPMPGDDKSRIVVDNVEGEGDALVFFDGGMIEATWKKEDRNARTIFFKRGTTEEIEFVPGQFWVEVVPTDKEVTWQAGLE